VSEGPNLTFSYRARDTAGQRVNGAIEACSQADALRLLQRDGLTVTDLRLGTAPIDPEQIKTRMAARNIGRVEVIAFSSQIAIMLETGVPLAEALRAFVKQSRSGDLKRIIEIVADRISSGLSFSAAIEEFPKVFPSLMVSLMKASEASGTMSMMLGRISDYLSKERRTARQIKSALTYPMIMITLALVTTGFMVVWVLPRFAKIYESRQAALPVLTRIVLDSSRWMTTHWAELMIGALAACAAVMMVRSSPRGRRWIDALKIRMPVIGPIFTQFYLTRAARTLGTLLASGVSLLSAIRIVRGVTNNHLWTELWNRAEASLTAGQTLASVVLESPLIPPSTAQMIAAGEKSGRLPEVLERIAQSSEESLDEAVKNGTQLIEPVMIVFMGITIGGVALALLLPIFSMASVVSQ